MSTAIAHVQFANGTAGTNTATSYTLPITGVIENRTAAGGMYLLAAVAVSSTNTSSTTCTATYGGFAMTSLGKITSGTGLTQGFLQVFGLDLGTWPTSSIPLNANLIATVSAASTITVAATVYRNAYGGFQSIITGSSPSNTTSFSGTYNAGTNFVIADHVVAKQPVQTASPGMWANQAPNTTFNAGCMGSRRMQGTGAAISVSFTWSTATPYGKWVGAIGGPAADFSQTDSGTFTESASLFVIASDPTDVDQTFSLTETSDVQVFQYPTGTDGATESDSSALNVLPTESGTLSETARIAISSSDTATGTDSSSLLATRSLTDSATFSEVAAGNFTRSVTDTATVSDTATSSVTQSVNDSATETDALSGPINTNSQVQTSDLSAVVTDTADLFVPHTKSDTATETESRTLTTTTPLSDSATFSESRLQSQSRSDTAALNESSTVGQTRFDTAGFIDSTIVQISRSDAFGFTETETHGPVVSDLLSETDSLTGSYNWIQTVDLPEVDDHVGNFIRSLHDEAALTDSQSEESIEYRTEDPLHYADAYYFNRDFRIIAQDHFTREFIHWDLPLDNVQITFALSGPNLLSGTLSTEMLAMELSPKLMPDRTWLHVEADGQIRASFLLTPFIDDPITQTRHIEAEGFSAYPHWITYQGAPYTGIQVDPADMVRKLWDHVQSYPDGNLGVKVTNTKTPVRVGEPPQSVNFNTAAGNNVSFQAGPYTLNYWSVTNCGDEIDKLCKETPIDYYEYSRWNSTKTDVEHYVILGYPRVGTKRGDIHFREGVNLTQVIPAYEGSNENYASEVVVIGAGNGPTAIRAIRAGRFGLLRKTNVIQNQNITRFDTAVAIANFEFSRFAQSRFLIQNIIVDTTHYDSLWGSFMAGDDIFIESYVPYAGEIKAWYRITSYVYDPYFKTATLSLAPSESFTYGATNVDPYKQLPTAGFARLSQLQDFSKLFASNQQTLELSQLQAYQIQNAQQFGCDTWNKYQNAVQNNSAIIWRWIKETPDAQHILPQIGVYYVGIQALSDLNNHLIICKDSYGHIITGDNILLLAQSGAVGQLPNTTSEVSYPNPYYVPDKTTNGQSYGSGSTPSTGDPLQDAAVKAAQTRGMELKNNLQNGRGEFYQLLSNHQVALVEAPYPNTDQNLHLIVGKDASGNFQYGTGFTTNSTTGNNSGLQQAAQLILNRMQSGQQIFEDWTWQGYPAIVGQYNDQLLDMYDGYQNMSPTQFLSAVISGQIK